MSITFEIPGIEPLAWRVSCYFDNRRFADGESASLAARAHPKDGCAPALEWYENSDPNDEVAWAQASRIAEETGYWPDVCLSGCWAEEILDPAVPRVNMSEGHARVVLEALGLVDEFGHALLAGSTPAQDMVGRCLLAAALVDDPGVPSMVVSAPGQATLIDCGRPVGYVTDKVLRVLEVARFADTLGRPVQWG